jgi:hypothetical protein
MPDLHDTWACDTQTWKHVAQLEAEVARLRAELWRCLRDLSHDPVAQKRIREVLNTEGENNERASC